MERRIWKAHVFPGKLDDYIRCHEEIWPEMVEALRAAGVRNYSIWNNGDEIIGYYECPNLEAADAFRAGNETVQHWNEVMKDIMHMDEDAETGQMLCFRQIFELE